jgi:hypothetical protein
MHWSGALPARKYQMIRGTMLAEANQLWDETIQEIRAALNQISREATASPFK